MSEPRSAVDVMKTRLRLLRAAWRAGSALDQTRFAEVVAMAAVNPYATGAQLKTLADLPEPYLSQCAAAFMACPQLPVKTVRQIAEFDDPFRSQCLAALMSHDALSVDDLRVVYAFADPYRSQCLAC